MRNIERLTAHWKNNYVPTKFDLLCVCDMNNKDYQELQNMIVRLAKYEDTGLEPEEIMKLPKTCSLDVGQTVFVITKYGCTWEVIECIITRKTAKTRNTFSVEGRYQNGNYYNGTFVDKSIGRNVFLSIGDALVRCSMEK